MFSHFLRKLWPFPRAPRPAAAARAGGVVWSVLPEAGFVPDLDRWLADGRAVRVKHGPHRTVYRVDLPGGAVYLKHCRVSGPRAWAREVLRPAKARLEFENALALADRGIPAVRPLAWGSRRPGWPGESYLVTAARDGAVPLVEFLETVFPTLPAAEQPAIRRQLARELGTFLAKLHAAGVAHPDPHPGNLLVELPPSHVPKFALIDLHAVRFGRPLTWAERRTNLVLYNRWFQLRGSRSDRLRFWHSYTQGAADDARRIREVEDRTLASNRRFWAGREGRCLGSNRYFRRVTAGAVRGFTVADLPDATVREIAADPDAAFARPGVRLLKDSPTGTVAELVADTAAGPRALILKRFRVRNWVQPLKGLFRRTPALRSWVAGHTLRDRWLPTPRPLLVLHRRRFGLNCEGYLLVEKVPDAAGLAEGLAGRPDRPAVLADLARVLRRMHDHAVSHRDLKAANVMLPAGGGPVFIDLVGVRTGRVPPAAQRAKELARLNASFLGPGRATAGERLRFLLTYLRAGLGQARGWRGWWARVAGATAAKVAKNRRSGRPLG